MKWLAKIFTSLFYFLFFFSHSNAADKDSEGFIRVTYPKKSQSMREVEDHSPLIKKNGVLDLHRLSQRNAYTQVVQYITGEYYQSKVKCHVMTGRGNHISSNGQRGVLRAKFPEWVQTPDLINFVRAYSFDEINGTYIVLLNQQNSNKKRKVASPFSNYTISNVSQGKETTKPRLRTKLSRKK